MIINNIIITIIIFINTNATIIIIITVIITSRYVNIFCRLLEPSKSYSFSVKAIFKTSGKNFQIDKQ